MNYKISQQQIDAIIQAFYQANAPVQIYEKMQNLFKSLEVIKAEVTPEITP